MSRVILVLLAISLVTPQLATCEAFIFDFMGKILTLKGFLGTGLDLIKSIQPRTEKVLDQEDTNELLEQISQNIIDMSDNLKRNFTAIFEKIDQLKDEFLTANIKESFGKVVSEIGGTFNNLVKKQIKTNKNTSWISSSEVIIVANYETDLEKNWQNFQMYLFNRKILDFLKKEESNDVCQTGISSFQLLEVSLNQYMSVANQYLFSQHIIYNIREHIDKHNKSEDRREFNRGFQSDLERDVEKIKTVMGNTSTEYWLCDPDNSANVTNFVPETRKENKQGSSDCFYIQESGYHCIPINNNKNCDCIKSTMVISTVLAKADPGYVITGAQITIDGVLLYILANQAKLLPNGQIEKDSIKPVTKGIPGEYANFVFKEHIMEFGKLEIPQGRFMTAVGFQKSSKRNSFNLGAESMQYDFERKQFITSDIRRELYKSSGEGTTFTPAVDIEKGLNGKEIYHWADRIYPLIDNRLVQSTAPGPLSGIGLFLRGPSEKKGYLAIKINTYNTVPYIPKIPSLDDLPIQEMLENILSTRVLHDLEKKFESYD